MLSWLETSESTACHGDCPNCGGRHHHTPCANMRVFMETSPPRRSGHCWRFLESSETFPSSPKIGCFGCIMRNLTNRLSPSAQAIYAGYNIAFGYEKVTLNSHTMCPRFCEQEINILDSYKWGNAVGGVLITSKVSTTVDSLHALFIARNAEKVTGIHILVSWTVSSVAKDTHRTKRLLIGSIVTFS